MNIGIASPSSESSRPTAGAAHVGLAQPPAWQPLGDRLATVGFDEAVLSRLVHDARFAAWLANWSGSPVHVAVRTLPPPLTALEFDTSSGAICVVVEDVALPTALGMALALPNESLACEVTTALLVALAPSLATAFPGACVRGVRRCEKPCTGPVVAASGLRMLVARADRSVLAALRPHWRDPFPVLADLGRLRLVPRLRLFTRQWTAAFIDSLGPGDVVLSGSGGRVQTLIVGTTGVGMRAEAQMAFDEDRVEVTGEPTVEDDVLREAVAQSTGIDQLELPVAFEIDTARISLAELGTIRPGYVVELDTALAEATVRLVCHGKTIGEGQLVAIGDQLGVRISRMGLDRG